MINITKPLFLRALLVLLLQLAFFHTQASHVVGAEVTYKCTSTPGIFEVTMIIYRNCDGGIPLCPDTCGAACSLTMDIKGADPAFASTSFGNFKMSLVNVRDVLPNPDCPQLKNTCTNMNCVTPGTYTPGIERYEFIGFANVGPTSGIPSACCNVRFAWEHCCRSTQVATILPNANFYIDATINRCLSVTPCNSSPVFENEPPVAICADQNFRYNNGCYDPDIDSLSFAFAPALAGFNSSVSYVAPWSAQTPMPYSGTPTSEFPGGIRCDPGTGDISFTPGNSSGQNFTGVMAIEVKQWKTINGVPTVIGITRRDMQTTVMANCPPNNPPRLVTNPSSESSSNAAPKTNWEVCSGQQLCFTISAIDTDFFLPILSDTTYLTWNRTIASLGATFKPVYDPSQRKLDGPREDEYQFCWTPEASAAKSAPYYFTVKAKDSRCPNPGTITRSFSIKVNKSSTINDVVNLIKSDSGCGHYYITAVHNSPIGNTLQRFVDVSLFPNDPTFIKGSVTYPYHQFVSHIFNEIGTYNIRYRAYDTVGITSGCTPFMSVSSTIYNSFSNPTEETIETTSPLCFYSSEGRIKVSVTNGLSPFMFSLNNTPFTTDSIFNNLAGGMYNLRIKDNIGCIKEIRNVAVKNAPRVFWDGEMHANKGEELYAGDTVTYNVVLTDINSTVGWNITNGTALSAPGKDFITVKWNKGACSIQVHGSNNGCFDTIAKSMTLTSVGMPELPSALGLSIYPNPTKNTLTLTIQNLPEHQLIYLYDFQGKLVLKQELKLTQQLNLQELPQGVYMLKVGDWHGKVVKN